MSVLPRKKPRFQLWQVLHKNALIGFPDSIKLAPTKSNMGCGGFFYRHWQTGKLLLFPLQPLVID